MSEDRWPGEDGWEELYAAFAALGGPLTRDEFMQVPRDTFMRLLGSPVNRAFLVRQASLLLGGDAAAAEAVVQDSFAALQDAWSRLGDLAKARLYLYQMIVNRSRSVRRCGGPVTTKRRMRQAPGMRPPAAWTGKPGSGRCAPFQIGSSRLSCCTRTWGCPGSRPPRQWASAPGRPGPT